MAAETVEELRVLVTADTKHFNREMKLVKDQLEAMNKSISKTSKGIGIFGVALGSAVGSIITNMVGKIPAFVKETTNLYAESMGDLTKLGQAMANFGDTEDDFKAIVDIMQAEQKLGVVSADAMAAGAQELRTYFAEAESLRKLIPVMNDMAVQQSGLATTGESVYQTALQLGKAMNGTFDGLTKSGYTFSEADKALFKLGTEQEKVARLSEIITENIGGMNHVLGETDSGKMVRLANSVGDLKAQVGALFTAIGNTFAPLISKVVNALATAIAYVKQFLILLGVQFNSASVGAKAMSSTSSAMKNYGKAAKQAGKDVKSSLAAFDEMNVLTEKAADNDASSGDFAEPNYAGWDVGSIIPDVELPPKFVKAVEKVKDALKKWSDHVKEFATNIKNSDNDSFSNFRGAVGRTMEAMKELWDSEPMVWFRTAVKWVAEKAVEGFIKQIESLLGVLTFVFNVQERLFTAIRIGFENIMSIVGVFKSLLAGDFAGAWDTVRERAAVTWGFIKETGGQVWSWFSEKLSGWLQEWQEKWNKIGEVASSVWGGIKNVAGNAWDGIQNVFVGAGSWFSNIFQGAVDNIKKSFNSLLGFFAGLWSNIKNTFTAIGNGIASAVGGAFKAVINGIISVVEKTLNVPVRAINGAMDSINKLPGVNLPKISELSFPRLATGGFARSGSVIAEIGENGREAVLPLDNNTEWADLLAERLSEAGGVGGSTGDVCIYIDGERFTDLIVKRINRRSALSGYNSVTS